MIIIYCNDNIIIEIDERTNNIEMMYGGVIMVK